MGKKKKKNSWLVFTSWSHITSYNNLSLLTSMVFCSYVLHLLYCFGKALAGEGQSQQSDWVLTLDVCGFSVSRSWQIISVSWSMEIKKRQVWLLCPLIRSEKEPAGTCLRIHRQPCLFFFFGCCFPKASVSIKFQISNTSLVTFQ